MSKTNTGLVNYAKAQLGKPYWYGTFGNTATKSLLASKTKQYPGHYSDARMKKYNSQIGERVHDCVSLIKGFLWSETATATPKYNSSQDVSANGMLGKCKEQGKISTIPEIPGVLVFMSGHVGVYIGNGYVIEARGFEYGVVKTRLKDRKWTHWGKCPFITYVTTNAVKNDSGANKAYFKKCDSKSTSIVDALKSLGYISSYSYRKQIATANGIKLYVGSAKQNAQMLSLLKQGKLIKP
jgi:cell wall-associated NlpC family hydrolase